MNTDGHPKSAIKVYRNGNIAWSSSTDMVRSIPKKQQNKSNNKLNLNRKNQHFKDIVYKIGGDFGIFDENKHVRGEYHPRHARVIGSCDSPIDNEKNKNKNPVGNSKCTSHLKWTRVCEILMTFVIVTTCGVIVANQTYHSISK